jgi:uncharacterized SAM-binding protein YcdF (DUF218 family)
MPSFLLPTILPNPAVRRRSAWMSLALAVLFAGVLVFLSMGRWLVVQDPLRKATAIAVFSGQMPERALEAARIYQQGYAPRVWLTHSTEPGEKLEKLGLQFKGEDQYDEELLMREGVPQSTITVLDPPIVNTADEVRAIGEALGKENQGTVILVTSKVHTRRVKALWNRLARNDGTAIVRGVSDDEFDAAHWWRNTRDALDVVREILGLMNVWAGLPLQPTRNN